MNLDFVPKVSSNLYTSRPDNDRLIFVLDPDKPSWVFVNSDGLEIINQCNGKNTVSEIIAYFSDKYGTLSSNSLEEAIVGFIANMMQNQIIGGRDNVEKEDGHNRFRGIALEITEQCNLGCKHCYLSASPGAKGKLSFEQIKTLLDETKELGGVSVSVGGGEALMHKDCLKIIEYAHNIGLLITLGSNGILIDKEFAHEIAKFPVKVQISLDGASAETHDAIRGKGSFNKTVRAIDYLIEEGKGNDIVLAYTVMKPNIHDIPGIIDFALSRDIHFIQFPPLTASGRARDNWAELKLSNEEKLWFWKFITQQSKELRGKLDLLADCFSLNVNNIGEPRRCSIGTQFRIDPHGDVYPCQCFHFGDTYKLGNINDQGLKELVLGEKIKKIVKQCFQRPALIKECSNCKWINFCGAGCMGNAFEEHGTIYRPDSCSVRKKWIEKLFEVELQKILADQEEPNTV